MQPHDMAHWSLRRVKQLVYIICVCFVTLAIPIIFYDQAMQWPGWKLSYATLKEASVGLQTNCKQLTVQ